MSPDDPRSRSTALGYKTPGIWSAATIGRRWFVSCLNRGYGWPRVYVKSLSEAQIHLQKGANNFGFLPFVLYSFRFVQCWRKFLPRLRDMWGRTPLWNSLPTFSHWYFNLHSGEEANMLSPCHCALEILTLWRRNFLLNFSTPCI